MKISVVGGGNAGCFTALHYGLYTQGTPIEVELIYDPSIPVERVGQATTVHQPKLLFNTIGFDWYHNPIHATMKSGILYEGWGQVNDKVFHPFPPDRMAMHYCPWELQKSVLKSGLFKVIEGSVEPKDVDADYVFDCRGKPEDYSDYEELKNPTNACILAKPNWDTTKAFWSRHVATSDGWTFVIPTSSKSPSHDYCVGSCYNSNITSKEDAESNFLEMFDVEITKHVNYKNYVAKNPVIDDRIFLNGNRLFFLEPLESSSTEAYFQWARCVYDIMITKKEVVKGGIKYIKDYISKLQNFILWHYQFGSRYDTPFWKYAYSLKTKDPDFNILLKQVRKEDNIDVLDELEYAQWRGWQVNLWDKGMSVVAK